MNLGFLVMSYFRSFYPLSQIIIARDEDATYLSEPMSHDF